MQLWCELLLIRGKAGVYVYSLTEKVTFHLHIEGRQKIEKFDGKERISTREYVKTLCRGLVTTSLPLMIIMVIIFSSLSSYEYNWIRKGNLCDISEL